MTMEGSLEPYRQAAAPAIHTDADYAVSDATRALILSGIAENTQRAYRKQWAAFTAWCEDAGRVVLPATPQTLAEYVGHMAEAGSSPSNVSQAIAAVRTIHRWNGHKDQPDAEAALLAAQSHKLNWVDAGNRVRKAIPVRIDVLRRLVDTCDVSTLIGVRNRAILVLGWSMMGRRSEVAGLFDRDVRETKDGLLVYVAKSKTDQKAKGREVPIPSGENPSTDPVRVIRDWRDALVAAGAAPGGRLFRSVDKHGNVGETVSGTTVGGILKDAVRSAGLPQPEEWSFHGMRAGGATEAYANGAMPSTIGRHGGWAENSPVVLGYIRAVDKWKDNPMKGIGL